MDGVIQLQGKALKTKFQGDGDRRVYKVEFAYAFGQGSVNVRLGVDEARAISDALKANDGQAVDVVATMRVVTKNAAMQGDGNDLIGFGQLALEPLTVVLGEPSRRRAAA